MEKKKRIVSKLVLALVLVAVVSMCFVGVTLARYVSGTNGSSTANVAKWDVSFGEDETISVTFGAFSPSDAEYSSDTGAATPRSNESVRTEAVVIANNGEVNADVTLTLAESMTVTRASGAEEFGSAGGYTETSTADNPTEDQVKGLFTFKFYDAASDGKEIKSGTAFTLAPEERKTIYATIVWTSADATLKTKADDLDTWVGENIESVGIEFTVSAVQGSVENGSTGA